MPIEEDRWLAERLGRPAFTLRDPSADEPLPDTAAPGFYQARVPCERTEVVAALGARGFQVVSTGITLARSPGGDAGEPGIVVRDADPARDEALLDLGERAFSHDRFHLDPLIPDAVADGIKRDWVASCLRGDRGEQMLVAEEGGAPIGFLAVARSGGARVIDLIAVRPDARGRGAGAALVCRFLADSEGRCDEVRVGTQAANPRATRFYESLGFRTMDAAYDMHLHV
jgi:ribosomal protein S18 acetylase RimI-like enzyme